jgi:hypothetical protein
MLRKMDQRRKCLIILILILVTSECFVKESAGFHGSIRRARVTRRRSRRNINWFRNTKYLKEKRSLHLQLHVKLERQM